MEFIIFVLFDVNVRVVLGEESAAKCAAIDSRFFLVVLVETLERGERVDVGLGNAGERCEERRRSVLEHLQRDDGPGGDGHFVGVDARLEKRVLERLEDFGTRDAGESERIRGTAAAGTDLLGLLLLLLFGGVVAVVIIIGNGRNVICDEGFLVAPARNEQGVEGEDGVADIEEAGLVEVEGVEGTIHVTTQNKR